MYNSSSDGEGHEAAQRRIPPASSMLWVRNLRKFIGSGAGLGSEALMELETKRILLEIFKEKQQKNAEAGTIPSFYRKESEDEVIDTEQAENWFSLMSAQRICDMFLALDKDMNGTLSKQEL